MSGSYEIDFDSGDYVIGSDNQVSMTDDATPELYDAIQIELGLYVGNVSTGSTLRRLTRGAPVRDVDGAMIRAADSALRSLVAAGTIEIVAISVTARELVIETSELNVRVPI